MNLSDPAWHWTVTGSEVSASPGAVERAYEDSGVIVAEGAGEALEVLINREMEWGGLDTDQPFTITIRRAEEEPS